MSGQLDRVADALVVQGVPQESALEELDRAESVQLTLKEVCDRGVEAIQEIHGS
jgi:hypothetical protein